MPGWIDVNGWWLMGARLGAGSMRRYFRNSSSALSRGEERELRSQVETEADEGYQEHLAEEYLERFEQFPRMMRNWHAVAIASTIEHEVRSLARMCQDRAATDYTAFNKNTPDWPREFAKSHDYLRDELGFQIPANNTWSRLLGAFILRNAIAHFDGHIDDLSNNQRAWVLNFANGHSELAIDEQLYGNGDPTGKYKAASLQPGFLETVIKDWETWLDEVEAAAAAQGFELP